VFTKIHTLTKRIRRLWKFKNQNPYELQEQVNLEQLSLREVQELNERLTLTSASLTSRVRS